MFQPPNSDRTDEEIVIQDNVSHFLTGMNLLVVTLVLQLLDIHWIMMGSQLTLFIVVQTGIVYNRFNAILIDFIIVCIIA